MHHLERYYSGNDNWIVFSNLYKEYKDIKKVQELARKFNDDLILASVIYGKIGDGYYLAWIENKIPALDYLTPLDCNNDLALINRLKEMLMRMP
ncbi:hypothetical protein [Escherichia albertii]|uniref:hypothetical protein n=1 Tax=Escherichia albertii TaxID=208962 RepID=UPI00074399D5|nr:hypothetical protein [Escherichia albertii]EEX2834006.1 hypothetical protein [Escherichia albertii]EFF0782037.1 hypothetical protein [Escherichia albertii]EJM0809391.1 hypothetical protein [Escherichia albertii]EJM1767725.1 hypothetical protein [Escherichia albertii]EJM2114119.1 hypothetical protein [Escherichia albertii]